MDILGYAWEIVALAVGVLLVVLAYFKIPRSDKTRKTMKTLGVFLVIIGIMFMFIMPWIGLQGVTGPGAYTGTFSIQISADNTAGNWDDTIVADVDLWAAGESDCNPVTLTCTVLITATQVNTAINTIAPDEALINIEVARTDNNPNVDDADDFVNFWITAPGSIPYWTNTTDYTTFDTIGSDTNGRYYMYVDDEGGDAFWIAPGETLSGAWMQPGDTETVAIGVKLLAPGYGADGQTADVSQKEISFIAGGHTIRLVFLVVAIS